VELIRDMFGVSVSVGTHQEITSTKLRTLAKAVESSYQVG
jgi:hypothetical protein